MCIRDSVRCVRRGRTLQVDDHLGRQAHDGLPGTGDSPGVDAVPGGTVAVSHGDGAAQMCIRDRENILAALDKIHAKGKKAGVVVKPKTPASAVLPFIDKVELILVMTVEPGFGGQQFMAAMMPKVQAIRGYIDAMNPACELELSLIHI